METTTRITKGSPGRGLVVGGIAVALLIGVTALIAVGRRPVEYPAGSPESTVQAYAQAVINGDEDAAVALLSTDEECDADDLADAYVSDDVRITLRNAEIEGDRAEVEVTVSITSGQGPFDTYEYDQNHRFELERSDGRWLITERPWPWASCWR